MNKKTKIGVSTLLSAGMVVGAVAIASPSQARERSVFSECSAGNPFEFSVDRERRAVDFDFDIERATPFERWTVKIDRNGQRVVNGTIRADEDGDASRDYVRRSNTTNPQTWVFNARSASGNTCKATIRN